MNGARRGQCSEAGGAPSLTQGCLSDRDIPFRVREEEWPCRLSMKPGQHLPMGRMMDKTLTPCGCSSLPLPPWTGVRKRTE